MFNIQVDDAVERWIFETFALLHFCKIQIIIVIGDHLFDNPVIWIVSLDHYLTLLAPSPCTAAYLCQHLETAFIGPVIRKFEHTVCIDDPNEGNIGKIQAFSYHLSTYQYIYLFLFQV